MSVGTCPRGDLMGGNCPEDNFPEGNYSGVIVRGAKVRVLIAMGEFHWGNCLGTVFKGGGDI